MNGASINRNSSHPAATHADAMSSGLSPGGSTLKLFFPSRFAAQKWNSPDQGNRCRIHGPSPSKLICIGSAIATGFGYERWRILAHCGGEAFYDDDAGLDFGESLINHPHCWAFGRKA